MFEGHVIAAVVPAYNESAHIADVIRSMPDIVDHIVVVDDRSTDRTYEAATEAADNRTIVIRHAVNEGVGGAIITAHRRAIELGSDINVVMAGDGQMDPQHLPALLAPLTREGYGFTKANRFYSQTSYSGMPRHRVFGNILLTLLTKSASGYYNLVDPQNGYTAIRTDVLARLPLERIAKRYEFENDLLIHLNIVGARAKDVPIPAVYGSEVSSIRLHRVVPRLSYLLFVGFWRRIWWKYVLWSFSPIALMFFFGLGLLFLGGVAGAFAIASSWGVREATSGTILLAVVPTLTGTYLLIQAWMLDIMATPD